MAEGRPKKIALIGATGYEYGSSEARVECCPWDRLRKVANLADYDLVILNLLSLQDPQSLDVETFTDVLNVRAMLEVVTHSTANFDGAVFVLGDPRFNVVEAPPGRTGEFRER